ncbi:hypothetical protein B0H13DRAFT_1976454 [Mycena leptocephala]|nr:hypothetical protein B0H13DRAFT_1976454 [Mycena leptocephala]
MTSSVAVPPTVHDYLPAYIRLFSGSISWKSRRNSSVSRLGLFACLYNVFFSLFFVILAKIRAICGAGFRSLHFCFIWLGFKRLVRLRRPMRPKFEGCDHSLSSLNSRTQFSRSPCVPHAVDICSVDLAQSVNVAQESCSQRSRSSISTKACQEPRPEFSESGQCPESASTSETQDGGSTLYIGGTDRLQPMAVPPQLRPILPKELLRYEPKPRVSTDPATFAVKPLQTEFHSESTLPPGWVAMSQFEGQVFFYHKEKNAITETWLYYTDLCNKITDYIQMIDDLCDGNLLQIPENSELVLELRCDEVGETFCGYYFAHTETRSIFWLEDFCIAGCLEEVKGGWLDPQHTNLRKHFEYFETIHVTPTIVLRELREMVVNALTDTMTSHLSTVTHTEKQLANMLKIIEEANKDLKDGGRGCPLAIGKCIFKSDERFLNFYGQESSRLTRYQPIYNEPPPKRSWRISILSPILFYGPDEHLHSLDKIWVDKIAAKEPWSRWIGKLTSEWAEHTAFATILLNANVALLEVPGVAGAGPVPQSLPQIFSSISLVLSVGSAVLGLMLVRQHRTKRIGTAEEAVNFFTTHDRETTAIFYSLPYALLMYGMGFFWAAFLSNCFLMSLPTRLAVGIFCALTSVLVLWCLLWQASEDSTARMTSWLDGIKSAFQWHNSDSSLELHGDEDKVKEISVQEDSGLQKGRGSSLNAAEMNV